MKIVFISDVHNRIHEVVNDIPSMGYEHEVKAFFQAITRLKEAGYVQNFVGIAGNHDLSFQDMPITARSWIPDFYEYLENDHVTIHGVKFHGSPITPEFMGWGFGRERGEIIKQYWDLIPDDTDVLVTHGPPMGILDWAVYDEIHVGCEELRTRVMQVKPKIHAFGHIHGSYGQHKHDNIKFVNASNLNEGYKYTNKPIIVEI